MRRWVAGVVHIGRERERASDQWQDVTNQQDTNDEPIEGGVHFVTER